MVMKAVGVGQGVKEQVDGNHNKQIVKIIWALNSANRSTFYGLSISYDNKDAT